jgi:uroporphyrinogen III methyltransferase/synthase
LSVPGAKARDVDQRGRPLAGQTVVVARAAEQAGGLVDRLHALGAGVVEVPVIAITDPADGGAGLVAAAARLAETDWVVVTSPNGARRLAGALPAGGWPRSGPKLAVVGPGTAEACKPLGLTVDLVPERFVAEGLLEALPDGPGRVLVAQAEAARPVLVEGLRHKGWTVDVVAAYRTVPAAVGPAVLDRAAAADAIVFTSGSTVRSYVAAAGEPAVPATVVCIGPVTAAAAVDAGLTPAAVASDHSLDGLVTALVEVLKP